MALLKGTFDVLVLKTLLGRAHRRAESERPVARLDALITVQAGTRA